LYELLYDSETSFSQEENLKIEHKID